MTRAMVDLLLVAWKHKLSLNTFLACDFMPVLNHKHKTADGETHYLECVCVCVMCACLSASTFSVLLGVYYSHAII